MRRAAILIVLCVAVGTQAATKLVHRAPQPPLEALFSQLAQAGSSEDAKPIENRIGAIFMQSGSASVDLLMARAAAE